MRIETKVSKVISNDVNIKSDKQRNNSVCWNYSTVYYYLLNSGDRFSSIAGVLKLTGLVITRIISFIRKTRSINPQRVKEAVSLLVLVARVVQLPLLTVNDGGGTVPPTGQVLEQRNTRRGRVAALVREHKAARPRRDSRSPPPLVFDTCTSHFILLLSTPIQYFMCWMTLDVADLQMPFYDNICISRDVI